MASPSLEIRPLSFDDFPEWLPLWNANNMGYSNEAVTTTTWGRLNDHSSPVNGLAAIHSGKMAGFVHFILHPVTGHIEPACYMQDLYVNEEFRQKGIGSALVKALTKEARTNKWARLYWLAEADNAAAQALYSKIGVKLDFTLHVMPLR